MARMDNSGLWLASEGANFATDPSASGALYLPTPAEVIGPIKHGPAVLRTDFKTTRGLPTPNLAGSDAWSLDVEFPWFGLASAAGDGVAPPADDWLDVLLTHAMGLQTTVSGEGLASSTGTSFVLDTDAYNVQHVLPVFEAGLPTGGPRTTWNFIETDAGSGTYTVSHTPGFNYTTAAVAYGSKAYQFAGQGGNTIALYVLEAGAPWTLLGGRVDSLKLAGTAGGRAMLKATISGDRRVSGAKGSIPTIPIPTQEPVQGRLSPLYFGATEVPWKSFELDFGLSTVDVASSSGTHGRGGRILVRGEPSLAIVPEYTAALQTDKDAQTRRRLELQLGAGVLSGGILNSTCIHALAAQIVEADAQDDGGLKRQGVKFEIKDLVEFSAGVPARFLQVIRA